MLKRLLCFFDALAYLFMGISLVVYLLPQTDSLIPLFNLYEEDQLFEWLSVVLLVAGAVNFFIQKPRGLYWSCVGMILLFLAGEEISWFQRVLHLQPNEFFIHWNDQAEINLHGLQINNFFFEHILLGIFGLFILPMFYPLNAYSKLFPKPLLGKFRYIVVLILVIGINLKTDLSSKENVIEEAVEMFIYCQLFRASFKQS